MTDHFSEFLRIQQAEMGPSRTPTFAWKTTLTSLTDTVKLVLPPNNVLPIIFIPGIMGSNLQGSDGKPVWLMNKTAGQPLGLAWMWARKNAGQRQAILHPSRTSVYSGGSVPSEPVGTIGHRDEFTARGWGEVGETSYHEFLLWAESKLNGAGWNPAERTDFSYTAVSAPPRPGGPKVVPKLSAGIVMRMEGLPLVPEKGFRTEAILSDDLLKRATCRFPVYACGYNWLQSNFEAAERLRERIDQIIAHHHKGSQTCRQVILVTHSMAGLVARACVTFEGMSDKIAGIVHGVMPATGAPVAYRRCKVGMADEDFAAGLVIGSNGREVTSVFAQAPGALQLLPSQAYKSGWMRVTDDTGRVVESLPKSDPYEELYLRRNVWWGLVNEQWLTPLDGIAIKWGEFERNIEPAKDFHQEINGVFHKSTFVYYGAGNKKQAFFETIDWRLSHGIAPGEGLQPTVSQLLTKGHHEVRTSGTNMIHVGGRTVIAPPTAICHPALRTKQVFGKSNVAFRTDAVTGLFLRVLVLHRAKQVESQFGNNLV